MNTEPKFVDALISALNDHTMDGDDLEMIKSIRNFKEVGMLTRNSGFVVHMLDGSEFQITVVMSKAPNQEL